MKKLSNTLFPFLSKTAVEKLTTILTERLATDYENTAPKKKIFTAADLWNIQRQRKAIVQRRNIF